MTNHLTKEHIGELTSKINYSNFESERGICKDVPFYSEVMHELKDYLSVRDISDKITKALCYVYMKKPYYTKLESDLCSYMYYWIGDKIYANTGNNGEFTRIMRMLYDMLNGTNKNLICIPLSFTSDMNTFYKNKLLFDYSQDHEHIKIHTAGYKTCSKQYKEHMEIYIRTYTDAYSDYYFKKENKYDCKTFFSLFEGNQYDKLSSFHCVLSENSRATLEQPSVFGTHEPAQNEHYKVTTEVRDSVGHHSTAVDFNLESNPSSGIHQDQEKIQPVPIGETTEGGSSKTIAGSIAPVLGVSSFSLLLYKVTPVGGFINRLLGRNGNMYNNIDQMDEFNPYSDGMNPGGRTMNISYNRL